MKFKFRPDIAKSKLANQNCRIGRGVPNYNNFCQQQYGCVHSEENRKVSLSSMRCSTSMF